MIQRIQSVFLLLAGGFAFGPVFAPYLTTDTDSPAVALPALADGRLDPFDNVGLIGLTALSGILSLAAIFLFRNRILQGRLAGLAIVVSILLVALMVFIVNHTMTHLPSGGSVHLGIGLALPVVAAISQWLAARYIRKDEKLVRSIDRLR